MFLFVSPTFLPLTIYFNLLSFVMCVCLFVQEKLFQFQWFFDPFHLTFFCWEAGWEVKPLQRCIISNSDLWRQKLWNESNFPTCHFPSEKKVFLSYSVCWHKNLKTYTLCALSVEGRHTIGSWFHNGTNLRETFSVINYFRLLLPYLKIIYPCITDTHPACMRPLIVNIWKFAWFS